MASRRWIWEQYDHLVMGDTMIRPGADSGVVRVQGTDRGLAMTVDCTPRYCVADPETGGAHAVVESWRNITAVGATPPAVTHNLKFGNPKKPAHRGTDVRRATGWRGASHPTNTPHINRP